MNSLLTLIIWRITYKKYTKDTNKNPKIIKISRRNQNKNFKYVNNKNINMMKNVINIRKTSIIMNKNENFYRMN